MDKRIKNAILVDYLEEYSIEVGLKEVTIKGKRGTLLRFLKWLKNKTFNSNNCRKWARELNKAGWKPNSIKHEIRVLRATIKFLHDRGYIKENFASQIPYPKVPKKQLDIVPIETAEKIIITGTAPGPGDNSINRERKKEYRIALRFFARTGLRSRELIDLEGKHLNIEEEIFYVRGKSGNTEVLPMPKDFVKELSRRVNNDRVFKVTRETLNRCLKRGCETLNIKTKIRTHTLRHIFCTTLLKNGVPMQEVSRLMRHSSISITDSVYSHYVIDDLRLSLNSRHPLIREGLTPSEFFKTIQEVVKATGIFEDNRFGTNINIDQANLAISIQTL